jgi:CxxC-x17-CxxC domain-containing protein
MSDQTLSCRDCGQAFTFTSGEQAFFASRGFTNAPSRCPDCRAARKAERNGGYASGMAASEGDSRGGYGVQRRELFPAVCGQCGNRTLVPFQPRGDRPVYCSDCFGGQRSRSYADASRGRGQW